MNNKDYEQPEFYHFSQDSIELAKYVSSLNFEADKVLDLFAGCGVVGIEFIERSANCNKVYFLEKEPTFISFLEKNCQKLKVFFQIIEGDFEDFKLDDFDLIIANPPFYSLEEGRIPKNELKRNCHFMGAKKLSCLMEKFLTASNNGCQIYFLGRRDLSWIRPYINLKKISIVKDLNKTSIFKVNKTG